MKSCGVTIKKKPLQYFQVVHMHSTIHFPYKKGIFLKNFILGPHRYFDKGVNLLNFKSLIRLCLLQHSTQNYSSPLGVVLEELFSGGTLDAFPV